jgi:hypothetical protein
MGAADAEVLDRALHVGYRNGQETALLDALIAEGSTVVLCHEHQANRLCRNPPVRARGGRSVRLLRPM